MLSIQKKSTNNIEVMVVLLYMVDHYLTAFISHCHWSTLKYTASDYKLCECVCVRAILIVSIKNTLQFSCIQNENENQMA